MSGVFVHACKIAKDFKGEEKAGQDQEPRIEFRLAKESRVVASPTEGGKASRKSQVVQWLGLRASTAGGHGFDPWSGS